LALCVVAGRNTFGEQTGLRSKKFTLVAAVHLEWAVPDHHRGGGPFLRKLEA
jgi:hypothetical protein